MEEDSGAACYICFIILLMIKLLLLSVYSIAIRLQGMDIDKQKNKNGIQNLIINCSGVLEKYQSINVIVLSIFNFTLGVIYMLSLFSKAQKFLSGSISMFTSWPEICVGIVHMVMLVIILTFLYTVFGVWIPKVVLLTFHEEQSTEEQILSMVNEGHEQGELEASEAEMITNIFEFGDKQAKDIMTDRSNIVAIDGDMLLTEAIDFMIAERNSRYPVYDENLDHIVGILHFKDAVRLQATNKRIRGMVKSYPNLIRKPIFIPETRNLDTLFHSMQSEKTQMVIVVDEYGQTSGLVAMEDVLEEIVGNIMDEYDEEEEYIEEKGENIYEIDGLTPLDELEEELEITFDADEFDTLNGFLISKMEHIPSENEKFELEFKGYYFKVLEVDNKMIKTVLVKKMTNG